MLLEAKILLENFLLITRFVHKKMLISLKKAIGFWNPGNAKKNIDHAKLTTVMLEYNE